MEITKKVREIDACRISASKNLISVLKLGEQVLTGVFPKTKDTLITKGPLELVLCPDSGLLQLKHSYDPAEMYGMNYGYRSGLNSSMVQHLQNKVNALTRICSVRSGDIVLDIGSNDATLLKSYLQPGLKRIGIDPTGKQFAEYYTDGLELIPEFFSAKTYRSRFRTQNAKIITSIAMFYDLESPKSFVSDIEEILDSEGIWHFEQSYMPSMLQLNSYDTTCHEHLEYYSLEVVKALLEDCGLKIIDVQVNSVNGESFAITAAKHSSKHRSNHAIINRMLEQESKMELRTLAPYRRFEQRVHHHRDNLLNLIRGLASEGKSIIGYGASTKGNVILQFCKLTEKDLPYIAEVNSNKFGSYTPGTLIPIISEAEAKKMRPDYMLVLPWHFKTSIIQREQEYLAGGGKLIIPLPEIEVI